MLLLLALLLAMRPAGASSAGPAVVVADGRVTAHLEATDRTEVLHEVARQAGLEVRGSVSEPRRIGVSLDAVPIAEALSRLLAGENFLLTYGGGRLRGVRLLGGPGPGPFAPPPSPSGSVEQPATGPVVDGGAALAASHRAVAIGGRLARAVGADETSFAQIMGVALRDDHPRVRADALRVGLRILDAEPELRARVFEVLDHWDEAQLAAWLEHVAGDNARDVARRAARSSSDTIRLRAEGVMRHFAAREAAGS